MSTKLSPHSWRLACHTCQCTSHTLHPPSPITKPSTILPAMKEIVWLSGSNNNYSILSCYLCAPSYPGLLTSAFVTCSTNVGEGLVKLITCSEIPGPDFGWMCGGVAHSFCSCIAVRQLFEPKSVC